MGKTIYDMSYPELLAEEERIKVAILKTKSIYTKKDYSKYLKKIQKELQDYEKFQFGKVITQ